MRTAVAVALLVTAVAATFWLAPWRNDVTLPEELRIEDVTQDLSATPEPGVALAWLKPSNSFHADGGYRHALATPPPAVVRFRVRPPEHAALRFAVGVEGTGKRDRQAAGVRFAVSVDGHRAFSRVVNPAADRHDRRWFDERIDLDAAAGRDIEIVLGTEQVGSGALSGTPGWSDVRVVGERRIARQVASANAPNLLFVLVDTLRADRLGCYGAVPSPSPTLDRLAAGGVVFEHMVAQASWTMPAVASIMTGLYPRDHGLEGWDAGALSNVLPTFAERAAAAGITTVAVSANPLVSRRTNFARGFETFTDFAWDEKRKDWAPAAEVTGPFFRWLERNHRHRFLAYLHFMEPHDPYTPPEGLRPAAPPGVRAQIAAGRIDGFARKLGGPETPLLAAAEVEHLRRLYDGEIRAWDAALGEVLAALAKLGLADSTLVVVTADHGEEFQEHGRLKHGSHLYDETIHVPLVIAGPSLGPARRGDQAQEIDLFPTVMRLLGIASPAGLPGRDLLDATGERPVFSETHHGIAADGGDMHLLSVRTAAWKLIHTPSLGRFELYDLAHDPGEHDDRFATAPESAELQALLARWEAAAPPPPESAAPDPALREKLRALGYVQ